MVARCGMPLGYEAFAGNRHDATTVKEIVNHMEALYGRLRGGWDDCWARTHERRDCLIFMWSLVLTAGLDCTGPRWKHGASGHG